MRMGSPEPALPLQDPALLPPPTLWGMSPHPGAAVPRAHLVRSPSRSCALSPAPGWPWGLVLCLEVPAVAPWRAQCRGRAEQLVAASQSLGPAGEEGIKLHLFPLFKGKEQRHLTQASAPAEHSALLRAFLPFAMPSCPSLSPPALPWQGSLWGIPLGNSAPFTRGVPRRDIPSQQDGWDTALEVTEDLGQGLTHLLLCWWLLGHRTLVLASSLPLPALLSPLGGFPASGDVPKAGVSQLPDPKVVVGQHPVGWVQRSWGGSSRTGSGLFSSNPSWLGCFFGYT